MSMCLVKRIIPFAAALTLGLFVTSFFVTVAAPQFNFKRNYSSRKYRDYREMQQLRNENLRLQEELRQQKRKTEELEIRRTMNFEDDFETLPPPVAPRRIR